MNGLDTKQLDQKSSWVDPNGDVHSVEAMPIQDVEKAFCFLMEMAMEVRVAYEVDLRGGPEKVKMDNTALDVAATIATAQMEADISDPIHYAQRWIIAKPLLRSFMRRMVA